MDLRRSDEGGRCAGIVDRRRASRRVRNEPERTMPNRLGGRGSREQGRGKVERDVCLSLCAKGGKAEGSKRRVG